MTIIYKLVPSELWSEAQARGAFDGSPVDHADGYIHFSTAEQLRETARRHFSGVSPLLLAAVDAERLGPALRWEPSRGGALFPHLYAVLDLSCILRVWQVPLDPDGVPLIPEDVLP